MRQVRTARYARRAPSISGTLDVSVVPRVLHIVPQLLDEAGTIAGGSERYALELARHMTARVPTRLLSFGSRPQSGIVNDVAVRIVAGNWHATGRAHNPMSRAVVPEVLGADVVHCHQRGVMVTKAAALCARLSRRR